MHNFSALRIVRDASETPSGGQDSPRETSLASFPDSSKDSSNALHSPAPALLAVIKANAYGHGIDPCAAILAAAGAEWLGGTDAYEGIAVRTVLARVGIPEPRQPRVLVMCGTAALPGEAARMVQHRLTPVVWTAHHIASLAAAARDAGVATPVEIHLEIDTGMSRQGVPPGTALDAILAAIAREPLLALDGVLTHFASTEVTRSPHTSAQQRQFETALAQVAASGANPRWIHAGNSSFIDNGECVDSPLRWLRSLAAPFSARAMVRSGLALYGYVLPIEGAAVSLARPHLLPVMIWKTRILAIAEVPAGAAIGYHGTFAAQRPMRLALLPAGYADGLRRELSSTNTKPGGWVMIHGRRAPIVGRISMNLTSVDVSAIPAAEQGDEATLLGEGITADDHAALANTIPYEILCAIRTSP